MGNAGTPRFPSSQQGMQHRLARSMLWSVRWAQGWPYSVVTHSLFPTASVLSHIASILFTVVYVVLSFSAGEQLCSSIVPSSFRRPLKAPTCLFFFFLFKLFWRFYRLYKTPSHWKACWVPAITAPPYRLQDDGRMGIINILPNIPLFCERDDQLYIIPCRNLVFRRDTSFNQSLKICELKPWFYLFILSEILFWKEKQGKLQL